MCPLRGSRQNKPAIRNFGLWFGNDFKPRDLGLIGYAAVSSPTLGAALENFVNLFAYHQQSTHMAIADAGNGLIRLEYRIDVPDIVARRQDAELSLGMFLNIIRECFGTIMVAGGSALRTSEARSLARA